MAKLSAWIALWVGCSFGSGCAMASQSPATAEPYRELVVRYELSVEGPVERWYACFEYDDVLYRRQCLGQIPGIRVTQGPAAFCSVPAEPQTLCRAFSYEAPSLAREPLPESSESDASEESAAGEIAGAFAETLVRLFFAAASGSSERQARSEVQTRNEVTKQASHEPRPSHRKRVTRPPRPKRP